MKAANEAFGQVQEAYSYSKNSKTANEIWNNVITDGRILRIVLDPSLSEKDGGTTNFVPEKLDQGTTAEYFIGTLTWDNNTALAFLFQPDVDIPAFGYSHGFIKGEITPTTALVHDLGHVDLWIKAIVSGTTAQLSLDKITDDKQYQDKAEKTIVTGIETSYITEINTYELSLNPNSQKLQPIRFNYEIKILKNITAPLTNPNNFHSNSQVNDSYMQTKARADADKSNKKQNSSKTQQKDTPKKKKG